MKSKFFKDTQGLESAACAPDKVSVCMRLSRRAYDVVLAQSARLGLTSGEYIEALILSQLPRAPRPCGTETLSRSNAPSPRPR